MLSGVSPIYDNSLIAKGIYQTIGMELDRILEIIGTIPDQIYPETATWGIPYLEQAYSLPPDPSMTLEQKRARLRLEMTNQAPINPANFAQAATDLTGFECEFNENVAPYTQEITVNALPSMIDEAKLWRMINKRRQSHMKYNVVYVQGVGTDIYASGIFMTEREYNIKQAN